MRLVPKPRVRDVNDAPVRPDGEYVLYWMIAARRASLNFALDRSLEWCRELGKPLIVLEALRVGYPHASDRLHRFVLDGMRDNEGSLGRPGILYHPYVEPKAGAGKGLLAALAERAAVVVTDDSPSFFLPRMVEAAGRKLGTRLEAVDGNGLLPLSVTGRVFPTAYVFRQFLHKHLGPRLEETPKSRPFAGLDLAPAHSLPPEVTERWPRAAAELLRGTGSGPAALPVDHSVAPCGVPGGTVAAREALRRFLDRGLPRYAEDRNKPEEEVTSGLSPYLHFGHISAHEVFLAVADAEGWTPDNLNPGAGGKRAGYWGMGESAEGFLDQLVTWRELGYHTAAKLPDHDRYDSLPPWALETLADHEADPREHLYSLEEFEEARAHDPLWNAAQNQLRRDGVIHNYLRMLWGKKILEWTASPREALDVMLHLNDKYALDGRDPNSVSGIFWCLGRYDRPWGPERLIFGKVRYMTSENTARKVRVRDYVERYS
jgi:deoxyribodipyrimidine photo-lyase